MSEHCHGLNPNQIELLDQFKRFMNREGLIEAGDAEYVSKIEVGRTNAAVFVTADVAAERLSRIAMNFIRFVQMRSSSIQNYHVSICDE